jgi:hypothetical protein
MHSSSQFSFLTVSKVEINFRIDYICTEKETQSNVFLLSCNLILGISLNIEPKRIKKKKEKRKTHTKMGESDRQPQEEKTRNHIQSIYL